MNIVELIRRKNRARLERRRRRLTGQGRSWLGRLVERIRLKNRERLARRRATRQTLESLAANDTAMLEALVFLLQASRQDRHARQAAEAAMAERFEALQQTLAGAMQQLAIRTMALERRVVASTTSAARGDTAPAPISSADLLAPPMNEPTARTQLLNPETDLLAHLARFVPCRVALDVGANVGDVTEALLDAGLAVHAFEPAPATFGALTKRLAGREGFVPHAMAVGRTDGTAQLHLASDESGGKYGDPSLYASLVEHAMLPDLRFEGTVAVEVRTLETLHRNGEIPAEVGIVKIDTEGLDLEVIRGMGDRTYPVVVAEFWDRECEFGRGAASNRLDELVAEMRRRGYPWHVVVYRVWGRDDVAWYPNRTAAVERSWGNVLFFRDQALFAEACRWCAAVLPQARFVAKAPESVDEKKVAAVRQAS